MAVEKRFLKEKLAFGKRLKELRKGKRLSQLDLEIKSTINRTEISRIERGLNNLKLLTMVKLAEALDVELEAMFSKG